MNDSLKKNKSCQWSPDEFMSIITSRCIKKMPIVKNKR